METHKRKKRDGGEGAGRGEKGEERKKHFTELNCFS